MRDMPGLMSHMLPLPVSVSEDLANSMFCSATQLVVGTANISSWHDYLFGPLGNDSRDQSQAGAKVLIGNC
ncbi:hypothetical protein Golob_008291 [Gossypium lobatum]|uniref:Uncharacterized protein n=1 Tax=Gossypium lobatum TaxID=34289 RepID=A0A7J8MF09_9ROSI|nr:hypothetical protein [Gossypium lobatum]